MPRPGPNLTLAGRAPLTTPTLFGIRDVGPHREIVLDVMPGTLPLKRLTSRRT